MVPAAGSLPVLPHRSAPCCRQGRAGSGSAGLAASTDGLLLSFPLQQEGPAAAAAAAGGGGGCPGPSLCGGARPLSWRQGRRAPAAAGRSLGSPWQPSARMAHCPGPSRSASLSRGSPALPPQAPEGQQVSPGAPGMGHWALHPQHGASSGAVLWPPPLEGGSSATQLFSCLSCRSCWLC